MRLCSKEEIFIPLGTMQGLVHTRGAAWMQGLPSAKRIVTYVEMEPTLCYFDPLCFHLQHCLAEDALVSVRDAIRAAVRVGLPRAVHASVYKLSTNLQKE